MTNKAQIYKLYNMDKIEEICIFQANILKFYDLSGSGTWHKLTPITCSNSPCSEN